MDFTVLQSTFLLTFLLLVGLFFFIRASTKDRTEVMRLISEQDENTLMTSLKEYFRSRAYQVLAVDAAKNQVTFEDQIPMGTNWSHVNTESNFEMS